MNRTYVSFDWAIKKLLRDKANFDVLEGFLSELLQIDVKIQEVLESEANKMTPTDKQDRVDILVKSDKDETFIVELHNDSDEAYFCRMLQNVSKIFAKYVQQGELYGHLKRAYVVNILCFNLEDNTNYLCEGVFWGVHHGNIWLPSEYRKGTFYLQLFSSNNLKNETKLQYEQISEVEELAYKRFVENRRIEMGVLETAEEEGIKKGKTTIAQNMKAKGFDAPTISELTGLTIAEINEL